MSYLPSSYSEIKNMNVVSENFIRLNKNMADLSRRLFLFFVFVLSRRVDILQTNLYLILSPKNVTCFILQKTFLTYIQNKE